MVSLNIGSGIGEFRLFIQDGQTLEAFCERAASSHVLAVDTEFLREKSYYPKLCLIQLGTHDETAAIDPLAIRDLAPVRALLEDPSITKIFHACSQDIEVIHHAMGCVPAPIFDTQVAAAFLGMRQQISYGALVEAYAHVHLPKAESLTDWSLRPLDERQLEYAEDDVRYLPGIYDAMIADLVSRDRLSWVLPEMEHLARDTAVSRDPRSAFMRLKRATSLTRRQLGVAREVCAWREQVAARRDIPRKWVLSDEVCLEICKRVPETEESLRRIRQTDQLGAREAAAIVSAVKAALALPLDELPRLEHHERPTQEQESIIDLMYAMLRVISARTGIAAQVIATRDDLMEFISSRETSRLSTSWRYDVAGRNLEKLLAGEIGLTVKGNTIELL